MQDKGGQGESFELDSPLGGWGQPTTALLLSGNGAGDSGWVAGETGFKELP